MLKRKDKMESFSITCIVLGITAITLHGIGATFLLKTNTSFTEHIELFSLSLSSVILYILFIVGTIFGNYYPGYLKIQPDFKELPKAASIQTSLQNSSLIPVFTAAILLTLQRFFAVRLHLRYESSCIFLNRIRIIIASWLLGIIIFVVAITIIYTTGIDSSVWKFTIIFPGTGLVATNIAFFSVYTYIYIKFKQARREYRNSVYNNRNKGKFFTPIIICGSFFVFGTLPYFFNSLNTDVRYMYLGVYLDGISNSVVYIFWMRKLSDVYGENRGTIALEMITLFEYF